MHIYHRHSVALLVAVTFLSPCLTRRTTAGPLTSAQVTKIINQVSVVHPAKGGHPATLREVIKDDLGLQTGVKSRSELLFQDNTLTRFGAETFFSFKTGTRDMTLEKGSMLLQVPKGLGGATIHTAAVTAAITGTTIMMEYIPDQYIKVLVLEGSLRLARNGTFGDSLVLHPGKMVIMRPDAKKIPDPIDVNLEHIVKTSTLVNFPNSPALPSMPLIQAAIDDQNKRLAKNDLVPTNLVMGHGTNVTLAPNTPLAPTPGPAGVMSANISGGPVPSLKGAAAGLPVVGPVASSTVSSTTIPVNNPLGSVVPVANNLLGVTPTAPAVSVSSSTQLLALLSTAAPASGGIITISPSSINPVSTVAAVPTTVTSIVSGVVNTTPSVASTVPSTVSTLSTIPSVTVPLLTSTSAPTPTTSTLTAPPSAPTSLLTGILTTVTSLLPLGLGH